MMVVGQRSILLVEDDPLLAMDVETCLAAAGYCVIGPVATTASAVRLIQHQSPDLVVLDLNLGTEMAFALPDFLTERKIPFIILTGHSQTVVAPRYRNRPFLQKPYVAATLLRAIRDTLQEVSGFPELKPA